MIRIGHGYDAHRFEKGRPLIIGGENIEWEMGLAGHSDADVLAHAICDSLFGAAALGDIGRHFPDTDPKYKNADSMILLKKTAEIINSYGYHVVNIDATILAQKPKLAPHIDNMRKNIANMIGIAVDNVSVKATTEEGMGFTGRLEGISAHCVCLIEKN
ncbi:MAG: 2-C-methyl-D-erythritol 2,4-cyclodiphosphate synthase [Clostridia bacterium]|nr:2-C-methyl-D-erythritol 2,4-cyclodiphosphate synthase [Clostridia bacterium]